MPRISINAGVSNSQLDRITKAKSLSEAQTMGILERLKDWWRNGASLEGVRLLFTSLFTTDGFTKERLSEEGLLRDFALLRCLARPEYAGGVKLDIFIENPQEWTFKMRLEEPDLGHVGVREGRNLKIGDGRTLAAFLDYQALIGVLDYVRSLSTVDRNADFYPAFTRLHDDLTRMNDRQWLLHGGDALWHPDLLTEKTQHIANVLKDLNLSTAVNFSDAKKVSQFAKMFVPFIPRMMPGVKASLAGNVVSLNSDVDIHNPFDLARKLAFMIGKHQLNFLPIADMCVKRNSCRANKLDQSD